MVRARGELTRHTLPRVVRQPRGHVYSRMMSTALKSGSAPNSARSFGPLPPRPHAGAVALPACAGGGARGETARSLHRCSGTEGAPSARLGCGWFLSGWLRPSLRRCRYAEFSGPRASNVSSTVQRMTVLHQTGWCRYASMITDQMVTLYQFVLSTPQKCRSCQAGFLLDRRGRRRTSQAPSITSAALSQSVELSGSPRMIQAAMMLKSGWASEMTLTCEGK